MRAFSTQSRYFWALPGSVGAGASVLASPPPPDSAWAGAAPPAPLKPFSTCALKADSNSLFLRGVAIENGTLAGGGGGGSGEQLALPPEAPVDEAVAAVLSGGWDPRDEGWWSYVLIICALLAIATLIRGRRSHPLARAADVHPWLEPLVPPDAR